MYKGNKQALELSEQRALVDHVDKNGSDLQIVAVRSLLHSGLRVSTLCHCKPDWLDASAKHVPRIRVPMHEDCECSDCMQKAQQSANHSTLEKEEVLDKYWKPKSRHGSRPVPVRNQDTWNLLSAWINENDGFGADRWKVSYNVKSACASAGFDGLTAHSLRHSYATARVEEGIQLSTLQGILGHKDPGTTSEYVRMVGDSAAEEVANLE